MVSRILQAQPVRRYPIRTPIPLHHAQPIVPLFATRGPAANIAGLAAAPDLPKAAGAEAAVAAPPLGARAAGERGLLARRVVRLRLVRGPIDGQAR